MVKIVCNRAQFCCVNCRWREKKHIEERLSGPSLCGRGLWISAEPRYSTKLVLFVGITVLLKSLLGTIPFIH